MFMNTLKNSKTICISGGSVLIARNTENGAEFLVAEEDYMKKVDLSTFKNEMKKYREVCLGSWCKQLNDDFLELVEIVKEYER